MPISATKSQNVIGKMCYTLYFHRAPHAHIIRRRNGLWLQNDWGWDTHAVAAAEG